MGKHRERSWSGGGTRSSELKRSGTVHTGVPDNGGRSLPDERATTATSRRELIARARKHEAEPSGPLVIGFDPAWTGGDRQLVARRRGRKRGQGREPSRARHDGCRQAGASRSSRRRSRNGSSSTSAASGQGSTTDWCEMG